MSWFDEVQLLLEKGDSKEPTRKQEAQLYYLRALVCAVMDLSSEVEKLRLELVNYHRP